MTDGLERLVNIEKIATEGILNRLLLFEERTKQNLEIKFNQLKSDALVDIHRIINEAFTDVNVSRFYFYHNLTKIKEKINTYVRIGSYKNNIIITSLKLTS